MPLVRGGALFLLFSYNIIEMFKTIIFFGWSMGGFLFTIYIIILIITQKRGRR